MRLLHNIGTYKHSNYNSYEQVVACREQLSFDGVYENVWHNRKALLGRNDPTILFVMWDYVGRDNKFDAIPNNLPIEKYCDWNKILDLVLNYNCKIASHTWTHRDLTTLSDEEVMKELECPVYCDELAYPYGKVDARIAKLAHDAGYSEAYTVGDGEKADRFRIGRRYL